MAGRSYPPALEGSWAKIDGGHGGEVTQATGYCLAESADELGSFQYNGSAGPETYSHHIIGRVEKSRGPRERLIKTLLSFVKGAPLTE